MPDQHPALILEEVTDPAAIAQAQGERCARNMAWLQAHAAEIYSRYRGKHLCIAEEALFVADTSEEAWALATAAYPEDDGRFLYYVPRDLTHHGPWIAAPFLVDMGADRTGTSTTRGLIGR